MSNLFLKLIARLGLWEYYYDFVSSHITPIVLYEDINNPEMAYLYLQSVITDVRCSCYRVNSWKEPDCDLEIIVPCYNVERYVRQCIESILEQKTRYKYHLTLINDGSTDLTSSCIGDYRVCENVTIIEQANKGLSGARNTGIMQAHGSYIMFVDSDDMLAPDAIESFLDMAYRTDAEIVDAGHRRFADDTQSGLKSYICRTFYNIIQRPLLLPYNEKSQSITGYPWGKVFKRSLFQNVLFSEGYWFEDTLIWMILEPMCKKKATLDSVAYYYRMTPSSIMHSVSGNNKALHSLYITIQLLKDRRLLGLNYTDYQKDLLIQQLRNNMYRIQSLTEKTRYATYVMQREIAKIELDGYATQNLRLKKTLNILLNGNFEQFDLWCKNF